MPFVPIIILLLSGCATQRDFQREVFVRTENDSYTMSMINLLADRVLDLEKQKIGFEPDGEGVHLNDIKRRP